MSFFGSNLAFSNGAPRPSITLQPTINWDEANSSTETDRQTDCSSQSTVPLPGRLERYLKQTDKPNCATTQPFIAGFHQDPALSKAPQLVAQHHTPISSLIPKLERQGKDSVDEARIMSNFEALSHQDKARSQAHASLASLYQSTRVVTATLPGPDPLVADPSKEDSFTLQFSYKVHDDPLSSVSDTGLATPGEALPEDDEPVVSKPKERTSKSKKKKQRSKNLRKAAKQENEDIIKDIEAAFQKFESTKRTRSSPTVTRPTTIHGLSFLREQAEKSRNSGPLTSMLELHTKYASLGITLPDVPMTDIPSLRCFYGGMPKEYLALDKGELAFEQMSAHCLLILFQSKVKAQLIFGICDQFHEHRVSMTTSTDHNPPSMNYFYAEMGSSNIWISIMEMLDSVYAGFSAMTVDKQDEHFKKWLRLADNEYLAEKLALFDQPSKDLFWSKQAADSAVLMFGRLCQMLSMASKDHTGLQKMAQRDRIVEIEDYFRLKSYILTIEAALRSIETSSETLERVGSA